MRGNRLLDCRGQLHFHLVAFVGQAGLYAGSDRGCVGIREPGIPFCLDSCGELHFDLVAFVGQAGLHAGADRRGASRSRHPTAR